MVESRPTQRIYGLGMVCSFVIVFVLPSQLVLSFEVVGCVGVFLSIGYQSIGCGFCFYLCNFFVKFFILYNFLIKFSIQISYIQSQCSAKAVEIMHNKGYQ